MPDTITVEGAGQRSSNQPVVRLPPQRRDLGPLRLDLQAPSGLLQVGRDGGIRVAPRPGHALPVPARHRSHRLRRHPASLRRQRALLMQDVDTIPRRTTPSSTTSSGSTSRTAQPTTGSNISRRCWQRSATMPPSFPGSRRSTRGAVCWRTGRRPRRIDGQRKNSFGRATSSSSNTSSAPWCNHTSIASRAHSPAPLDGLGHELRSAGSATGGFVLHLVLPFLVQTRHAASSACERVAEDDHVRRPLALDRDECRSALPALRCRRAAARYQSAPHLRRSA